MAFVKRIGCIAVSWLLVFGATGCGDDDEGDGGGRWKCFDDTAFGQCDCAELAPGDDWDSSGTEVDECPRYTTCVRYYDTFFESEGCSCGAPDLMPPDATDIEAVADCPP